MWWLVTRTSPKEVHVYPFTEQNDHFLDEHCFCNPEVKEGTGARMVVHKKFGHIIRREHPRHYHWIQD